ncbi:MAG: ABC transporter ATP-binding protein [Rhodospirillales bacterium]
MPETLPERAVEIDGLCKTYRGNGRAGDKEALKDVSLAIPRGSFFALLGPNGAGKSTLINILAGLAVKTAGAARIWGFDIEKHMRAARRAIGVVPQELNLDPFFTPREMLELQSGLYGVPKSAWRVERILEDVGLTEQADLYSRRLSGGMRRRLLVAKAMVHSPPVLVLDEPTAGVDIELRHQLWESLRALNAGGTTILLTTHYLEEAESLCDRIAIINHGRLIACESTRDLLRRLDSKQMSITVDQDLDAVPLALAAFLPKLADSRQLVFQYPPSRIHSGEILNAVENAGLKIADISTQETDLEDIFLRLTRETDSSEAA